MKIKDASKLRTIFIDPINFFTFTGCNAKLNRSESGLITSKAFGEIFLGIDCLLSRPSVPN